MSFMALNLLISVILVAFSNEQKHHKVNIYITNRVFRYTLVCTVYLCICEYCECIVLWQQ